MVAVDVCASCLRCLPARKDAAPLQQATRWRWEDESRRSYAEEARTRLQAASSGPDEVVPCQAATPASSQTSSVAVAAAAQAQDELRQEQAAAAAAAAAEIYKQFPGLKAPEPASAKTQEPELASAKTQKAAPSASAAPAPVAVDGSQTTEPCDDEERPPIIYEDGWDARLV